MNSYQVLISFSDVVRDSDISVQAVNEHQAIVSALEFLRATGHVGTIESILIS